MTYLAIDFLVALGEARSCLASLADSTDDADMSMHYDHLLIELDFITGDIGSACARWHEGLPGRGGGSSALRGGGSFACGRLLPRRGQRGRHARRRHPRLHRASHRHGRRNLREVGRRLDVETGAGIGRAKGRVLKDDQAVRFVEVTVNGPKTWSLAAALHPEVAAAHDAAQMAAAAEIVSWLASHATPGSGRADDRSKCRSRRSRQPSYATSPPGPATHIATRCRRTT